MVTPDGGRVIASVAPIVAVTDAVVLPKPVVAFTVASMEVPDAVSGVEVAGSAVSGGVPGSHGSAMPACCSEDHCVGMEARWAGG